MEGIVRFSIIVFVVISLLAYLLFVLTIKLYSELPVMREKYRFLKVLGMRQKERHRMISKEVVMFLMPPVFIASSIGFLHCLGYSIYNLNGSKILFHFIADYEIPSALWILPQMVTYILIMCLFTLMMKICMIKWIEKE